MWIQPRPLDLCSAVRGYCISLKVWLRETRRDESSFSVRLLAYSAYKCFTCSFLYVLSCVYTDWKKFHFRFLTVITNIGTALKTVVCYLLQNSMKYDKHTGTVQDSWMRAHAHNVKTAMATEAHSLPWEVKSALETKKHTCPLNCKTPSACSGMLSESGSILPVPVCVCEFTWPG